MNESQRLRVLMLGWEYPPHISGGLGTACEGLTKALAPLDVDIEFVVPTLYGIEQAPHMRLRAPELVGAARREPTESNASEPAGKRVVRTERGVVMVSPEETSFVVEWDPETQTYVVHRERLEGVETVAIPALLSPYMTPSEYDSWVRVMESTEEQYEAELEQRERAGHAAHLERVEVGHDELHAAQSASQGGGHYGRDLFGEVTRYAARVASWARTQHPEIVHAHDWMTFPAATRVARMHGVPLVVHVHSLEQDRSGEGANPTISAIEGAGIKAATRVIAVSHFTARQIHRVHGVSLDRIDVVHNGVYARRTVSAYQDEHRYGGPLVLFLGRITFQKGPEYFVDAAAKVLSRIPNAKFVMAGSGDMLPRMKERVRELGIEGSFEFPGFVRGADVEYLFSIADVYVMPSVSEPFGISALEAMSYETPVILSRQSGASEVLKHALKVDFWDVHKLASQIVAVLSYPELRRSIIDMAREEVRRVHWEAAAAKVKQVYQRALGGN